MNAVANRVAALRTKHEHSLRDAAARTGVSHTTIARIEQGIVVGSYSTTLHKIAAGYGLLLSDLLSPDAVLSMTDLVATVPDGPQQATTTDVEAYTQIVRRAVEAGISLATLERLVDEFANGLSLSSGDNIALVLTSGKQLVS